MKTLKTLIAATVLASAFAAGSASALTIDQVTSSANINVTVKDGVATVFGKVDSHLDKQLAERAVAKMEGVEEVRNLLFFN